MYNQRSIYGLVGKEQRLSIMMSMVGDKYSAVWVSHSSTSDFLKCPRAYFLKNVYKDPKTGRKMQLMSPPLALGQAVHQVLESLSVLPVDDRFKESLLDKFEVAWKKISGKKGGFTSEESEQKYKLRGEAMLRKVMDNPGPLKNLAIKIKQELPQFWLSEEDNIMLCGKIDWLEYFPDKKEVHIIDFKTGKREETEGSFQLPIYHLLVAECQSLPARKASYWYLELHDKPTEQELPDLEEARHDVLEIAKKIKLARQLERFKCPQETGCFVCKPMEKVIRGEAELVGVNDYRQDVYILNDSSEGDGDKKKSVIL